MGKWQENESMGKSGSRVNKLTKVIGLVYVQLNYTGIFGHISLKNMVASINRVS